MTSPSSTLKQLETNETPQPVDQFKSMNFHAFAIFCVVLNVAFTLAIENTPLGLSEGNAMIGNSIWLLLITFVVQLPLWLSGITLVALSAAQKKTWISGTVGSLLVPLLVPYFYFT